MFFIRPKLLKTITSEDMELLREISKKNNNIDVILIKDEHVFKYKGLTKLEENYKNIWKLCDFEFYSPLKIINNND